MNASVPTALRRRRVQAIALVIVLAGSALEAAAVGAGLSLVRDFLLIVVAAAMTAVILLG